jgi:hypothetical protein
MGERINIKMELKETNKLVIFEVFTAVTMKNAMFWDIKLSSNVTGNITSPLQSPAPVNAM